ncbi:MAG: acyl carrier protein [Geminicoccaceae bacterium]|nr:acyl carrier protein [Geminicoccaceae bacterium]
MAQQVEPQVLALLERYNPKKIEVTRETALGDDLNIDSVAAMDVVMEIEDMFEIDVPINQVADLRTVGDLVDLVRRQVEKD